MKIFAVALLILLAAAGPAQSTDDCNKLKMTPVDGAFREGVVDGRWVGTVLDYTGTNGFASEATAFSVGPGGNGPQLNREGTLRALGRYGDRMDFYFLNNKLYSVNDIYPAGVPHCCPTQVVVARYGFHGGRLVREGSATIQSPYKNLKGAEEKLFMEGCTPPSVRHAILTARLAGPYT